MSTSLEIRFYVDGVERCLTLGDESIQFGRSGDNEVILPDYSVSRQHAAVRPRGDGWLIVDLGSTNGVQHNGQAVHEARLAPGDQIKIGVFEFRVHPAGAVGEDLPETLPAVPQASSFSPPPAPGAGLGRPAGGSVGSSLPGASAPPPAPPSDTALHNATIVRSLRELSAELGLEGGRPLGDRQETGERDAKRAALDEAYASQVFGVLSRLARLLITTESDDEVLGHVMGIAFEVFPVDRGFILLRDEETGRLVCELMRTGDRTVFRPKDEVPISDTMLEAVMNERVALLTYDALSDQRLAGTESVRIHQIRAAMCTPLWSGEKIIGVMQLDTPHHTGTFTEPDVDLLATLANYCAVAIERNRNAREAEFQREVRNRLQRYHSPSVIEDVLSGGSSPDGVERGLKKAEVTVLFADIVGFTAISELSPPEEVAELMEIFFTHSVEAIFEHGGTLDKFIGDCVMAFFGAPMAQEDHALRAVRAAVDIRTALRAWNQTRREAGQPEVATRIAINSGPVVVGDIGSNRRVDYTILGNTVNVAARLEEAVAKPGDIVIGEATFQGLDGEIETETLGSFQLKGLQKQIAAHRVSG